MITPQFSVRQDDEYVYIDIKVVHLKAQNAEISAEGDVFWFSLSPYYLRLHFPGNIVDDDRASASLDISKSILNVKFPKETPGEVFPDLDLMTKLLARLDGSEAPVKKPLIQEIGSTPNDDSEMQDDPADLSEKQKSYIQEMTDAQSFDWQIEQEMPDSEELLTARYGFNLQYSGYLQQTRDIGNDINDLDDPETSTIESRREERIKKENEKFDPDYYYADFAGNDEIPALIAYEPSLIRLAKEVPGTTAEVEFSEEEKKKMLELPRRTYMIDSMESMRSLYLNLIPIVFAYCYDMRTMMDDHTSESAWTVGKLAANVACLDSSFPSIQQIKIACLRRALAYPLYRNYDLALKCWEDSHLILRAGKRVVLKALLDVNHLFAFHDVYYVYSKIVTEDYCSWIQTANDAVLQSLANDMKNCQTSKEDLSWGLEAIETAAV
ncbi:SHQ1 protein-domain-containing protein [Myxozyma melibiosi]|uniref:SHQ1 protein-domain-containing protein n=1 Tax=Myxozyma melibiosi TaxID=54550 RepID=A0ABR1FCE6_9ASCO